VLPSSLTAGSFNTGTSTGVSTTPSELHQEYGPHGCSHLQPSSDGSRLYAAGLDGSVPLTIEAGGNLTNLETFSSSQLVAPLLVLPSTPTMLIICGSRTTIRFSQPAEDFSSKISKLTLKGTNFEADVQTTSLACLARQRPSEQHRVWP